MPGLSAKGVPGVTDRLYREDPYLLEFEATVTKNLEHAGRPAVLEG